MQLRELRKSLGLTQKEFGEALGIQQPNIAAMESGRITIGRNVRARIREVYGQEIDGEFIPAEQEPIEPGSIKDIRKRSGISQTEFAAKLGISQSAVAAYESGTRSPGHKIIQKIQEVFGETITTPRKEMIPESIEEWRIAEEEIERQRQEAERVRRERRALKQKVSENVRGSENNLFREIRRRAGLSQEKFAESLGVSVSIISMYENGLRVPSSKVLRKIRELYGEELSFETEAGLEKTQAASEKKEAAGKDFPQVHIQSPLGAAVTLDEILQKTGPADDLYIRTDENKAYWVRGEESGSVDLW